MLKRIVSEIMLTLLLIGMLTLAYDIEPIKAGSTTIIVPDNFPTIEAAINAANEGDTIYVRNGTYSPFLVEKNNLTVIGENRDATIINGKGTEIRYVSDVTISGFTFQNAASSWEDIRITTCIDTTIRGNKFLDDWCGIWVRYHSRNTVITENIMARNHYGISLFQEINSTISLNSITNGSQYDSQGIGLFDSSGISIYKNNITKNGDGIYLESSSDNDIYQNSITNNGWATATMSGIRVASSSSNNCIFGNSMINNNFGIGLFSSSNKVFGNNIKDNGDGVYLGSSLNNIYGNNITNSKYNGVRLVGEVNNDRFYHNNFVNNTHQVSTETVSIWDEGYPSGGNYWSDYSGVDANGDGIGDTPYTIDEGNQDNYPLMNLWSLPWGNWSHYHSYIEIVRTLLYLNETYPNIVDLFSIGKSWQNRDIYCIRLTNESNTHPKPKLFFVGYHHAREPITAELALYFAVEAATKFGKNVTLTRMLNCSEIYIVPALNVDGFDALERNERQRKNARPTDEDGDGLFDEDPPDDEDGDGYVEDLNYWDGTNYYFIRWEGIDDDGDGSYNEDWVGGVDLNRNYGYQWNATVQGGSPYPWAGDYRGPAPFSEPETQAIRDLALQHNFKYAVSLHSGTEVIAYPWGYTDTPTPHDSLFREVAGNLSSLIGAPYHQLGGNLHTSSGLWDDWMYGNRSTFALTCEIYTNGSAWQHEPGPDPDTYWEKGIFQFFNPDPANIETVIQRWLPVFTYITNRAITEAYDIATTNVISSKTVVGQGYSLNINVTVANQGDYEETFNVILYANATSVATQTITLTSGNSTTITFTWNTTGFAKGNYTISAVADTITGETYTIDNTMTAGTITITIHGDVDGDFDVDLYDAVKLLVHYGAKKGNPEYNPICDIDGDGDIDLYDAVKLLTNYGQKDP